MKTIAKLTHCASASMLLLVSTSAFAFNTTNLAQLGYTVPNNLMVITGQTVVITLSNTPVFMPVLSNTGPQFQWVKDDVPIDGATNINLVLPYVTMDDVGTYYAFIAGQFARAETAQLNLSVYFLYYTNSNGGSLGVPVQQFGFQSKQLSCTGKTFDYWNDEMPFYGPNTSGQIPPFTNSSNSAFLDLTTCTNVNGATLDTGLLVHANTQLPSPPVACSDDWTCAQNSALSKCTVSLQSGMTYRVDICYRSATVGGLRNVTFSWYYHN